jgi:hypothetical protein
MLEKHTMTDRKKELIRFITKIGIGAVVGVIIGTMQLSDNSFEPTTLIGSKVGQLALLCTLITALTKIALKQPQGWGWLASFFFLSCFHSYGIIAWAYLILSLLSLLTLASWKGLLTSLEQEN